MRLFAGRDRAPAEVVAAAGLPRDEKVLAFAADGESWLLGTRRALVLLRPGQEPMRLPWERVQAADWDQEAEQFQVSEIGEYGEPRATYTFGLADPALLLQLVRERVTASVVLQRGQLVTKKQGFKVIGRRAPEGGPIAWMVEYDVAIDPADPAVRRAVEAVLSSARADVGE